MTKASKVKEIASSAIHHELQYQRQLFPIEIVDIYPSDQSSADLTMIGAGKNNKDYAIKRCSDGKGFVPASELFCYELARLVNIGTPEFDILVLKDNELAFGAVWEGGVHKISYLNEMTALLEGNIQVKMLDQFFSKVYAFDLFINNVDRHFGNYLFRESHNCYIALAYDYSRAWLEIDYKGLEATDMRCNTQKYIHIIKNKRKLDRQQAENTLDELSKINSQSISNIFSEMPDNWMTKEQVKAIIDWWDTEDFKDRVITLKREINNVLV